MSFWDWFSGKTVDRLSPSDMLPEGSIKLQGNALIVFLNSLNIPFTLPPQVWYPGVPDTDSMDPVFDIGHNNILIKGADAYNQQILIDFIKPGDIAVYNYLGMYVIHRIIAERNNKGIREFKFKGDNNSRPDPYWVPFEYVTWVSLGILH